MSLDALNGITQFKTGSTIANGRRLSDVAVNKYKASIEGLSLSQAEAALSATALNEEQRKQILMSAGLITSTDSVTAAEVKQTVAENVLTTAKQQEVLATFEAEMSEGKMNLERLQAIALEDTEAGAIARIILAKKGENAQNLKNIASGKALNTVLKEQLVLLLKNPLTWAVIAAGAVIGLAKVVEKLVVTEEELNEQIKELQSNWSELSSTIQSSAQSFQSLKKQADELIPRYAELAQGVDKYGKNVSLTDEEFSEFVSLNNQLGQMFPELVMGYDSNGNAILALSGNVDTLTESLYAFVEAQRIASAQTIADTMPEVMSNIDSTVESYEDLIQMRKDEMEDLKELYEAFKNDGFVKEWSSTGESMVSAVKILNEYGIDYNSEITCERNGIVGGTRYKITVDWDDFETAFNGRIAGFEKEIDDLVGRIEAKWKQLNPVVSAWLSTDFLYQDLDMSGQSLVTAMVGEIDFKSLGLKTEEEIQNYITNSIITPIYDMDTKTQQAFFEVFDLHEALNNGELSVQEYQDKINAILENGTYSQEFITIFKLAFAEGDLQDKYDEAIAKFGEDNKDTLAKFFTDNSINTTEEIEYWNKVTDGAQSATEAVEMYNKVKGQNPDGITVLSITDTVDAIHTKLKPAMDSLADAYTKMFTDDGFTHDGITTSEFTGIKSALDEMKESGLEIDYEEYESFVKVLSDVNSTSDDVHAAFDSMATMMVNASGVVDVTEENFNLLKQQLEELGVTNAEEVLTNIRNIQNELANSGINLTEVTYEEAGAFLASAEAESIATEYLRAYMFQKALADNPLNTAADIKALEELCGTLGIAGEYLEKLAHLKYLYASADAGGIWSDASIQNEIAKTKAELDSIAQNEYQYKVDFDFDGNVGGSGSGSGSGSDSPFDWSDLLDKEIALLEKQLEAGLIDFDTYLDKRLDLINQYYNEGKIAADEYYAYLEDTYEHQLSIYDKVIKAVTYRIDKEIDGLEKEKESIEETYNLRIESIQSEIDALEEARKKREQQVELEKALYEVEKERSQRDIKLYSGNDRGIIYTNDAKNLRDAEENLEDKQYELHISKLESQIESLEKEMNDATQVIDEQIEHLEEYKEQWNSVAEEYENAQAEMYANGILGLNWQTEVINGNLDLLNNFKSEYIAIQQALADAAWKSANEQVKAAREAAKGAEGSTGSAGRVHSDDELKGAEGSTKKTVYVYNGEEYSSDYSANQARINDAQSAYKKELSNAERNGMPSNIREQRANSAKQKVMDCPITVKKYHTGLDQGYVGNKTSLSTDKRLEVLQKAGNGDLLKSNEQFSILKNKELVLTEYQGINIADTLWQNEMFKFNMPDYSHLNNIVPRNIPQPTIVNIGDIRIEGVQNVPDFARELQKHLPNISVQYNGKH